MEFKTSSSKWKEPLKQVVRNPFIAIGNAIVMGDNLIYRGITKTANKISDSKFGRKHGITRKKLAYSTLFVATVVGYLGNDSSRFLAVASAIPSLSTMHEAMKKQKSGEAKTVNGSDKFLKFMRIFYVFCTVYEVINDILSRVKNYHDYFPIYWTVLTATAYYLSSNSNGLVDQAKEFFKNIFSPLTEQAGKMAEAGQLTPKPVEDIR